MGERDNTTVGGPVGAGAAAVLTFDSSARVVGANSASTTLFGYQLPVFVGMHISKLLPDHFDASFQFLGATTNQSAALERVSKTNGYRADGSAFAITFSITEVATHTATSFVLVLSSPSNREVDLETRLVSTEAKLSALDASHPVACMTFDLETMQFADCNKAAEDMFRIAKEHLIGATPVRFSPEFQDNGRPSAELAMEQIMTTVEKGAHRFFWTHKRHDDECFPCEINTCVREQGDKKIFVASIRDMTEQMIAEAELTDAKRIAEEANELKSQFLANMSHEIRTPLNGIIGLSDAMIKSVRCAEAHRNLSTIIQCGKDLNTLLDDILMLSKIEADGLELETIPVNIRSFVDNITHLWTFKAQENGNEIEFIIRDDVPKVVKFDPLRVRQCLSNLLSNAIKFTRNGTVALEVGWASTDTVDKLQFCVTDSGAGMTETQAQKVFKPFTQADSSIASQFGGTGLGLSIVKNLTELMGGSVGVETELGVGTTFRFDIVAAATTENADLADDIGNIGGASLAGTNVLYAEDNDINAHVLEVLLKPLELNLTRAKNGAEAVQLAQGRQFDVILMDIQMPVMSGTEAAENIKSSNGLNCSTPIIALTANVMPDDISIYEASGMHDVCSKPYTLKQLERKLRAAVLKASNAVPADERQTNLG